MPKVVIEMDEENATSVFLSKTSEDGRSGLFCTMWT